MATVAIAVEDDLSECVVRQLLTHTRRDLTVGVRYPLKTLPGGGYNPRNRRERRGLSGYGQLKVRLRAFNKAADEGLPFIVLTDLDLHVACPGELLPLWLGNRTPSPNLIFRVAVREVEAWFLADGANLAECLHAPPGAVPTAAESVADPKIAILRLAAASTSAEIQQDMLPAAGSTAEVGPRFERVLLNFAKTHWDIDEAARNARSLSGALIAIDRFVPTLRLDTRPARRLTKPRGGVL